MSKIYDEVMKLSALEGMEDIRVVLDEWKFIANNFKNNPHEGNMFLPDYLMVASPGSGVSTLLNMMSEYLYELGLVQFSLPTKFFEFLLEYEPQDRNFNAFKRYYNLVEYQISQFGRAFEGVICIDITEWVEAKACLDKRFIRFMEYLTQKDDKQVVIFLCNCCDELLVKEAESVIISFMRLRRINLKTNKVTDLMMRLNEYLEKMGLVLSDEAYQDLVKTLNIAINEKAFDGLKSIQQLAKDIIYEKYRLSQVNDNIINSKDIIRFQTDGEWLKQLRRNVKRSIGYELYTK